MRDPTAMNALIVEGASEVCRSTSEWLQNAGWSVSCVRTLAEARDKLASGHYGLLLLDLLLPDGHGLTLMPALRAANPTADVVIVTSLGTLDEAVEAIRNGVVDFVQKPCTQEDFVAMLRRLFVRRSLRRGRVEQKVDNITAMIALIMDRLSSVESELDTIRRRILEAPQ